MIEEKTGCPCNETTMDKMMALCVSSFLCCHIQPWCHATTAGRISHSTQGSYCSPARALVAMAAMGGRSETCAACESVSDSVSVKYVGSHAIIV
jgi:hypothetical protein